MPKKLYSNLDFQGMELLNVAEYTKEEILDMAENWERLK